MKKILNYLMAALLCLPLVSCEKDDIDSNKDSLVGTKWTMTYLGDKYVVEFTSKTDVRSYEADDNYNFSNYLHEDTYSYKNGMVTFDSGKLCVTDVIGLTICYYYYFESATIENDVMRLKTNGEKLTIKMNSNYDITDMKFEDVSGKNFNLVKVN